MASDTVYQFTVKDIDGKDVSLERYRGHVLCIVNVASKWGKTDANYTQMVQLAGKYPQLRLLLFPCNQFGGQEPGAHQEIKQFASKYNFKVRYVHSNVVSIIIFFQFDMFSKIDVNGSKADPLWVFLKEKQAGFLINAIKWNFTKFIVDKNGKPVARLGPNEDPIPAVEKAVEKYLWSATSSKL